MPGRGRTPKREDVRTLNPKARKRKTAAVAPKPAKEARATAGRPACPQWLGKEAKAKWREIIPLLESAGLLSRMDHSLLTVFCEAWGSFVSAAETLEKEGASVACATGALKPHPAVAMKRDAANTLRVAGEQLGLSPTGRLRLGASDAGKVAGKTADDEKTGPKLYRIRG